MNYHEILNTAIQSRDQIAISLAVFAGCLVAGYQFTARSPLMRWIYIGAQIGLWIVLLVYYGLFGV